MLVVIVQHLLGLATAVIVYLTLRLVDAPRLLSAVGAAVVALSPDFIFFEHAIMSEAAFLFIVSAALYLAVRALRDYEDGAELRRWVFLLAAAGAALALAAMFRAVAQILIPLLAVIAALGVPGLLRDRALAAGAVLIPGVALILGYSIAMSAAGGHFGLAKGLGWGLYARIAPAADCSRFEPAPGTEALCETSDPDTRPGPDFYAWNPRSTAVGLFIGPPLSDDVVGGFGRRAILAQPRAYAELVAIDMWRYVEEDAGPDRIDSGKTRTRYHFGRYTQQPGIPDSAAMYYGPYEREVTDAGRVLRDIQAVVRVHGLLVLVAVLLAIGGAVLSRGIVRWTILLLGGTAVLLALFPTMIGTYNFRYGVVVYPSLVSAGLLGFWTIWERLQARRDPGAMVPSKAVPRSASSSAA